jgi:hypothetical protein
MFPNAWARANLQTLYQLLKAETKRPGISVIRPSIFLIGQRSATFTPTLTLLLPPLLLLLLLPAFIFSKTLPGALRGPYGSMYILLIEPLGTKVPSLFGRECLSFTTFARLENGRPKNRDARPFSFGLTEVQTGPLTSTIHVQDTGQ